MKTYVYIYIWVIIYTHINIDIYYTYVFSLKQFPGVTDSFCSSQTWRVFSAGLAQIIQPKKIFLRRHWSRISGFKHLNTPLKSNIDTQNSHVWKEIHFQTIIFGICVIFRGRTGFETLTLGMTKPWDFRGHGDSWQAQHHKSPQLKCIVNRQIPKNYSPKISKHAWTFELRTAFFQLIHDFHCLRCVQFSGRLWRRSVPGIRSK